MKFSCTMALAAEGNEIHPLPPHPTPRSLPPSRPCASYTPRFRAILIT